MKSITNILSCVTAVAALAAENVTTTVIQVNQVGYSPDGPKKATFITKETSAQSWMLINGEEIVTSRGKTQPRGIDNSTKENVHVIDFAWVDPGGSGYRFKVGKEESYRFNVVQSLYRNLFRDAVAFFYYQRSGIAIDGKLVGKKYAREAGHVQVAPNKGDLVVPCQSNNASLRAYGSEWTCNYTLRADKGWYDAGDQGKYVVNGGIAVAQLLMAYERSLTIPKNSTAKNVTLTRLFRDGSLPVPEHDDGIPDVLNEARWELEFLMSMQVPAGSAKQSINGTLRDLSGLAHHKLHDDSWAPLPTDPSQDPLKRELHRPSTAATLNLAAAASIGSRLWSPYDKSFATKALESAKTAYEAAKKNPDIYAPTTDGEGGGAYDDVDATDEFYWAATELYLTTGEKSYLDDILASPWHTANFTAAFNIPEGIYWRRVAGLGRLQLATVPSEIPGRAEIVKSVTDAADAYIEIEKSGINGFGGVLAVWPWGSNSNHINNIQVIATAYDLTGDKAYRIAALGAWDYIFGRNGLGTSFVVGWGTKTPRNVHHRTFAPSLNASLPGAPKGFLSGGPYEFASDPAVVAALPGCAPSLCWLDDIMSYSTNEVAINWNSALAWGAAWLEEQTS